MAACRPPGPATVGGALADIADYLGSIVQHLLPDMYYFDNVPIYQRALGNTTHAFGVYEYGALYGVGSPSSPEPDF